MSEFFGVASQLPDPQTPELNWDAPCPDWGWPNMVVNAISDDLYFPEHNGPLSIKCSFGGSQQYRTSEACFEVSDRTYLILNNGQRYENIIEDRKNINSFCIFFRPGFPEQVFHALVTPRDRLLDEPNRQGEGVNFFEKLYRHDQFLSPLLFLLHTATRKGPCSDRLWLAGQFHNVLEGMIRVHRDVYRQISRLPAVKAATRVEQYRRLQRAREYIDSCYDRSLTLDEIASVACLSVHHFLRSFKQVFGITPYRYITQRRLEQARHLLLKTDLPISSICYDIGFESPGSFSRLFRRTEGMSPEQFRFSKISGMR